MSDQVPNPYKRELRLVRSRAESAVERTPDIDSPTESVGPGPAWSGPKAREFHDNELSPYADPIRTSLANLVADIDATLSGMSEEVSESAARFMENDLAHHRY